MNIPEVTSFENANTRLGDLLRKQTELRASAAEVQERLDRLGRERIDLLAEGPDEANLSLVERDISAANSELRLADSRCHAAREAIPKVVQRVIAAEEEARRALMQHWRQREAEALAETRRRRSEILQPWVALYTARLGVFGGEYQTGAILNEITVALHAEIKAVATGAFRPPKSEHIGGRERAATLEASRHAPAVTQVDQVGSFTRGLQILGAQTPRHSRR